MLYGSISSLSNLYIFLYIFMMLGPAKRDEVMPNVNRLDYLPLYLPSIDDSSPKLSLPIRWFRFMVVRKKVCLWCCTRGSISYLERWLKWKFPGERFILKKPTILQDSLASIAFRSSANSSWVPYSCSYTDTIVLFIIRILVILDFISTSRLPISSSVARVSNPQGRLKKVMSMFV